MAKQSYVYILASKPYGTLYIGVTAHLLARLDQRRSGGVPGFTSRYGIFVLVRYELYADMPSAIAREMQLKAWRRDWKIALIRTYNPRWKELAVGLGLELVDSSTRHDGS
ncbi:GIY-YIG nuclease family protein [Sphingomonas sp. PB4P5]|uniref:GIY-YIG nuclease family protein n=1 Tax=Parasphingomonas puruogangriensis TaxID=3096155 RepID=UPI002FC78C67